MNNLGFSKRLADALAARGMLPADLARAAGVSRSMVSSYLNGTRKPSGESLVAIENALGISSRWLFQGGESPPDAVAEPLDRPYHSEDPDQIFLPLFETRPAAGPGNHVHRERPATVLPFSRTWLRSIDISPQDAAVLKVEGDSMEPTLRHGEMVFLDTKSAQEALSAGIWVFSIRGQLFVKRLEPRPDGEVLAHSDNPAYSSFPVDLSHPSFKLIGRVAWAGRRP